MAFQSSIDLHGSRLAAAKRRVHEGLRGAAAAGQECVRIVTGKGHHSEDGVARLRVPYATGPPLHEEAVASEGPYRVRIGDEVHAVAVSEADVQEGRVVVLSDS